MIGSLKYFQPGLEEVQGIKGDSEYWADLRYRLTRMENEWKHNREDSAPHDAGVTSGIERS